MPWAGFFFKAAVVDTFVLLDEVQFPRRARWGNRNRIKNEQGELWLTVPVRRKRRGLQKVRSVEICYERSWPRKHLQSFHQHYCHAPYYDKHIRQIEDIYSRHWKFLLDLNLETIHYLGENLGIGETITRQSALGVQGKGTTLLIDLCRAVGAETYAADIANKKFLDEGLFQSAGINLSFFRFKSPIYPQLWGHFIENLSVIDLLFNCGEKSREILFRHTPLIQRHALSVRFS